MKIAVLQSSYLPWIGYFDQINRCDTFIVYDDVPYDKKTWRNRNRLKCSEGACWLTVPVLSGRRFGQLLKDVEIDNSIRWRTKHLKTIEYCYRKAPYFNKYFGFFEEIYRREWKWLVDLNNNMMPSLVSFLGIKTNIVYSPRWETDEGVEWEKNDRIINICKKMGASGYLSGDAGREYIVEERLINDNIALEYQHYSHPQYPQLFGDFIPYLSIADLLFNCGDASLKILTCGL